MVLTGITQAFQVDVGKHNHEETLAAAFAAAGYTGTDAPNEDVGAYLMYDATDSITVQMAYVASYQQTLIRIYPSHVEPN